MIFCKKKLFKKKVPEVLRLQERYHAVLFGGGKTAMILCLNITIYYFFFLRGNFYLISTLNFSPSTLGRLMVNMEFSNFAVTSLTFTLDGSAINFRVCP